MLKTRTFLLFQVQYVKACVNINSTSTKTTFAIYIAVKHFLHNVEADTLSSKTNCKQKYDKNVDTLIRKHFPPVKNLICRAQGRQSAKLFLQSSEWGLPHPLNRRRVCPPILWSGRGGGAHSLAGEGLGEYQFRRGNIHCGAHIYK